MKKWLFMPLFYDLPGLEVYDTFYGNKKDGDYSPSFFSVAECIAFSAASSFSIACIVTLS